MGMTLGRRVAVLLRLMALLLALAAGDARAQGEPAHHHMGASMMPFDLGRSLHIFTPLPDGGVQDVVSLDHDARQIALIGAYLQGQAALRDHGDYSAPAAMHGPAMPGLGALEGAAGRLRVSFLRLPDGGRIRYATHDAALVRAVHAWFKAQVEDHGMDAMLSHQ